MSYDEALAQRVRRAAASLDEPDAIGEKKMFGGLAFLRGGKMFCGIAGEDLMVRVGPVGYEAALRQRHVRPMDFTGRPLTGYVYVAPAGTRTDAAVAAWVGRSAAFVATLPAARKPRARR